MKDLPLRHCQICGNFEGNRVYAVRDMMFDFGNVFSYVECSTCGCLQIAEIPRDMSKYYPKKYYSFASFGQNTKTSRIRQYFRHRLLETGLFCNGGLVGKLLYAIRPDEYLRNFSLSQLSLKKESQILDVGCGRGDLIYMLRELGFKNSMGIDAFIEANIEYKNGTKIQKGTIHDISGEWDLLLLNHSFEHMPDQLEILRKIWALLSKNGNCVINMPTVSSYAWNHYREMWVGLDAPRHLVIHSIKSMRLLAEKANLSLKNVKYNSFDLQFWGSEQYIKGISLRSEKSYAENTAKSIFSKKQIKTFKNKTKELNLSNQGDSASFLLVRQE
jgi:2-polyprenyl-3-methyl-5-hydroxy-6-metoxy-1,4-benzoquinol methylase